jgi:DNA-binding Lrp family transcriptional regulator
MGQGLFYGYMAPSQPGVLEKLDAIDRKILCTLDYNGRLSTTAVAKALKLSREMVDYRIKQMHKRGLLTGVTTLVNVKRLGHIKHILYLRLHDFTKEKEEELVEKFRSHKNITWVASCGGGWDMGLLTSSSNMEEFSNVFSHITSSCKQHLGDYLILGEIKEGYAGRGLLSDNFTPKVVDREGIAFQRAFKEKAPSKDVIKLKPVEKEVLKTLIEEPLISMTDLAAKTGISVPTAKDVVTHLIKEEVVFGFMPMLSYSKLGYHWHMTFLRFNECSPSDERRLIEYFHQHPNILWYIKTVGPWNMTISVFAKDATHYREILNGLRKEFSTVIKDYDSVMIFNQHKYLHAI